MSWRSRGSVLSIAFTIAVLVFPGTILGATKPDTASDVFTAAATTDCGSDAVTLNLLHSEPDTTPAGVALKAALDAFTAEYPNITVTQNIVAILDMPETYETSVLAGQEPDIVFINLFGRPLQWLEQGATLPVGDLMDEWGLRGQVNDVALNDWTAAGGQLQGFPYFGFKWPVWYNTAELTTAGVADVPTSTDDLIAATTALSGAGLGGVVVGGSDWSGNKLFWQILQAYLPNDAALELFKTGDFSGPDVRKGVELFVALRDAGIYVDSVEGLTADQMVAEFDGGDAAIMPSGSWAFDGTPDSLRPSVKLGGFPNPSDGVWDKPTAYAGFTSSGWWLSPKAPDKIDAVRCFMQFMYRPETAALFAGQGLVMALKDVPIDTATMNPLLASALGDLDNEVSYVVLPDLYIPTEVLTATERVTSQAYTPGTSVDTILDGLTAAYANQ